MMPVAVMCCAGDAKAPLPDLSPDTIAQFRDYLDRHHLTPESYIISKFSEHDVVFLGEAHAIKHDGLLVQNLIPRLHEGGVHVLATEFARREDQALIDSLLSARSYDEALAREIQFRQFLHHGFSEYIDIFKAAWQLNRSLRAGEPAFRIVGMNNSPDWSHVKTRRDRDRDDIKRKIWGGQTEEDWARVVLSEVEAGNKVLVYCGMHHAFTEYRMPIVNSQTGEVMRLYDERVGNYVFNAIGKRAVTISLHAPWFTPSSNQQRVYPVDGVIDALMVQLGSEYYPVGFDTQGTPFGELGASDACLYAQGHDGFTLAQWCDGYVYHMPISDYEGMTPIPDFINEENLERARALSWDPKYRDASISDFEASLSRIADMQRRYGKLR